MSKDSPCLLAIDQGTTSSRAMVFDRSGVMISLAQESFPQLYPQEGWVEHNPEAIWSTVKATTRQALKEATDKGRQVAAIGITNQRETVIIWDRKTGKPIYNAIVWQDRRTADTCQKLVKDGHEPMVQEKTGLVIDPYFSASKIAWLLDHVDGARPRAEAGELACGTIDTFLIWRLTGGKVHATDATNACRTSLYHLEEGKWDQELLDLFRVPTSILPDVKDSAAAFGTTTDDAIGRTLPISGVAGDQQAATIGQACFAPGQLKSTYGTGCFALMNTGEQLVRSRNRLLSTIAYQIHGKPTYAVEGSIFIAGAAVQWLRDEVGIVTSSAETAERAARAAPDANVVMVPAFTGMGAPHWSPHARAAVFGMTRATGPDELSRAALEGVVYQTHDLFDAMARDGLRPSAVRVDGGMAANDWFVQKLSDILDLPVDRPAMLETTALGATYLAGLQQGIYTSLDDIADNWSIDSETRPKMDPAERQTLLKRWHACVDAVLSVAAIDQHSP